MTENQRPIWQILTDAAEPGTEITLTCDECFAIMEHLADQAVRGVDQEIIHRAIRRYIAHCPDCTEHHKQRLVELEAEVAQREMES